ncbi:hypothetical protein NBH00_24425 [Paraconexibacter antarcticus]|uniref:DUF2029 domain-containing protein n=1 Tax=Paraconexibacter antarcticus TaxID=2949664 RepID=A0ABY5DU10_9ACTN|nr:hypothetical protein [Paraconexibacter antarcticus]UTI64471.1 hypothetical protein NBH00_24425 [Paraconexibacter antarcticus]
MASALTMDPVRPQGATRERSRTLSLRAVPPALALGAVIVPTTWLVVAAAQRPSVLSPPSIRPATVTDAGGAASGAASAAAGGTVSWILGPLHGLHTHPALAPHVLHRDLLKVLIVVGVGWLVAWIGAARLPLRVVAGAVVLVHAVLFLGPPLPLTDVFNYGLYGRMASVHHLNPYRAFGGQAAGDPLYLLANWHHLRSPYGPLFTLASEGLGVLGVHGWFWAWKVVVAASSLGCVALVAALAGRLGVSRQRAVAAVGLSPLLLIGEVGGLHQDMPAVACLLGAAWCLLRGRDADAPAWCAPTAGALAVLAAGIKPSFAIVLGIVVLGADRRLAAATGAAAAGALTGLVVLLVYGGALPDVGTQSALVSPLSVPNLLGLAAGHGGADHAVRQAAQAALVLVAGAITVAVGLDRRRALSGLGLLLFASVLALSWVMPWYLVWALPFIALARPRALAPLAVVATCWLTVGGLSTLPGILHSAGYFPTRLATGKANHLEFQRLVK